jgi:hypothetical protein
MNRESFRCDLQLWLRAAAMWRRKLSNVAHRPHSTSMRRPWQRCGSRGLHHAERRNQTCHLRLLTFCSTPSPAQRKQTVFSPTDARNHLPILTSLVHHNFRFTGRRNLSLLRSCIPKNRHGVRACSPPAHPLAHSPLNPTLPPPLPAHVRSLSAPASTHTHSDSRF